VIKGGKKTGMQKQEQPQAPHMGGNLDLGGKNGTIGDQREKLGEAPRLQ